MRFAIIDEKQTDCQRLKNLIDTWANGQKLLVECDLFTDSNDFLSAAKLLLYEVVFLNIHTDQHKELETAAAFRQNNMKSLLIFLTDSQDLMPDAFEYHAFDYLIRPLTEERIFRTLSEAMRMFPNHQPYINLLVGRQMTPVLLDDIYFITADSNYSVVVTPDDQYRCRTAFRDITAELSQDSRFCAINRGVMVNLDFVRDMENLCCTIENGETFPINTRKSVELKQTLINHRFSRKLEQEPKQEKVLSEDLPVGQDC